MKFIKIAICVLLVGLLFSCGAKKRTAREDIPSRHRTEHHDYGNERDKRVDETVKTEPTPEQETKTTPETPKKKFASVTDEYIYKFAGVAKEEMELYGIPASITLAQGILESGSGYGELCLKSNNHFGIKCKDWKGGKVYHDDDEKGECFRKYKDAKYSFRDHSLFLANRGRYAFLFDLDQNDYKAWAKGLKKAGYATDPRYPQKLISLIERYNLDRFDEEVLGKSSRGKRDRGNNVSQNTYTVRRGDTLYSISKRFGMSVKDLKRQNNLRGDVIEIGQRLRIDAN